MNEADIPIDIHTLKLQDWLVSRRIVPKNIQPYIKDIRNKISNAIQDMPSNEQLIKLLSGAHINYYHCKEIVDILKQTEKDTKSLFGSYGSQRMKDWQEVIRLYEKENIYLAETAQIFVRNINFEIPGVKKQIIKLEQLSDDALKSIQDMSKHETKLLNEHAALLQQLGLKGNNLREEFTEVLQKLPEIYAHSIRNIGTLSEPVDLYAEFSKNDNCLPIIRHLMKFGNTTVYHYIHKEAPLAVEENPINLNLPEEEIVGGDNEIDFGTDDNGDSSTISGEMIDFGDLQIDTAAESGGDIDWGIESTPEDAKEIDFDIPIEEYGMVIEGVGVDGGTAKGDEAYTLLDSPNYRNKFIDELYELESFLKWRFVELSQVESSSNILFSLLDSISTYDAQSVKKMVDNIEGILDEVQNENTRHYYQLKHSHKYAEILASKLKQMMKAVEKIRATKEIQKERSVELKKQSVDLKPVQEELIRQTKILQDKIEKDISKRYKNRVVNLMGGLNAI
ncbi:CDK5RAP3-like protein [Episyrphus balteatus]|uniref:CDK5RAP3-like protein n=1 Tax=Episyrphus balteatus TaxID=286459 RepID=UPI002485E1A9|nr:CDK5RAP3-like protein [Episyrphus balteatus]